MGEIFRNILNASFQGGIVIAAILVLRLLLKKAPRRYICLLWILAGLRLLIPFSIESELSLQPENQVVSREHWQELRDYGQILPENIPVEQPEAVPPVEIVIPEKPADTEEEEHPLAVDVEVTYTVNWAQIAPYLWLIPVVALALYCAVSYLRLKRSVREAVKLTEDTFESDRIDTAFILGYFVPRIYLPMGMETADREMVLAHERSHLKNGDHWLKLIGFITLAIHWFNPLVWIGYICLCRDIELACDERVIRDMDLNQRKNYSAALLSCSANRTHFSACPVAFGEKPVRKRILAVLNYRKPGFWITLIAVIAVIAVAVCFLTSPVVKVDPLTLEDWGVTMTAVESSTTGVTVAFDLPEKTEGNFIFNMGDWTVQMESDGEWVDVEMLPQEEPDSPWNGKVSMLFPNEDVQRIALDWTTVYGEMPPGHYRVRGMLMLNQDGYGYNKDFYAEFGVAAEISPLSYTESAKACRVTEKHNPTISFSGATKDTRTEYAIYHFDPAIPEAERNACVFYIDAILDRMGLQVQQELMILSDYEGAWTDGKTVYLGAGDYSRPENGAKLIVGVLGGYANYGAAYGYAEYIAVQEGWHTARSYRVSLTDSDARDLNWLCFREEFVSVSEIESNMGAACVFAADYIADRGERAYVQLLRNSGRVGGAAEFNEALSEWYSAHGLNYKPTEILYAIGGEYHDYLVMCRYATFYMPREWENRHFSALAKDENFLHESYADVKLYYETAAYEMAYIQQMFGVDEDTSDIEVEFLLSGTGGTWAARNQIQLSYHASIPRSYLNMMLFRHTELRLHGGSYYEWLYHGLGEYMGQMVPSLYEDEVLLYSAEHGNRAYSTLEGDWFEIWRECVEGETDPDVYWRRRWDLMAYYYGTDFNGEGGGYISFTAYLIDQVGLQTLWDYFIVTENDSPEIDFAKYRADWEDYLEETYGQYPKFSDYKA